MQWLDLEVIVNATTLLEMAHGVADSLTYLLVTMVLLTGLVFVLSRLGVNLRRH
jgi:hypothetical protein